MEQDNKTNSPTASTSSQEESDSNSNDSSTSLSSVTVELDKLQLSNYSSLQPNESKPDFENACEETIMAYIASVVKEVERLKEARTPQYAKFCESCDEERDARSKLKAKIDLVNIMQETIDKQNTRIEKIEKGKLCLNSFANDMIAHRQKIVEKINQMKDEREKVESMFTKQQQELEERRANLRTKVEDMKRRLQEIIDADNEISRKLADSKEVLAEFQIQTSEKEKEFEGKILEQKEEAEIINKENDELMKKFQNRREFHAHKKIEYDQEFRKLLEYREKKQTNYKKKMQKLNERKGELSKHVECLKSEIQKRKEELEQQDTAGVSCDEDTSYSDHNDNSEFGESGLTQMLDDTQESFD